MYVASWEWAYYINQKHAKIPAVRTYKNVLCNSRVLFLKVLVVVAAAARSSNPRLLVADIRSNHGQSYTQVGCIVAYGTASEEVMISTIHNVIDRCWHNINQTLDVQITTEHYEVTFKQIKQSK